MNGHHPRYLVAVLIAVWVSAVLVGLAPALGVVFRGRSRPASVAAVVLLLMAATARYGPPDPAAVRVELDQFGTITEDVIAAGCDGIGGEPKKAWPQVFHVNMTLRERGSNRVVVGATCREHSRSSPWQHRWTAGQYPDGFLLAALPGQEEVAVERACVLGLASVGPPCRCGAAVLIPMQPTAGGR
jgi:hypothetical protein